MDKVPALPNKFVTEEECVALLFSADARPAERTWRRWKNRRLLPYVKVGRLCFYDPEAVRAALLAKFTVAPRKS